MYTVLFLLNAPGALHFVKGGRLLGINFLHITSCFKRSMHADRHTGTLPYAQCNKSSGSPSKKEYITMDAHIVVANMHVETIANYQDYTYFGHNIQFD